MASLSPRVARVAGGTRGMDVSRPSGWRVMASSRASWSSTPWVMWIWRGGWVAARDLREVGVGWIFSAVERVVAGWPGGEAWRVAEES